MTIAGRKIVKLLLVFTILAILARAMIPKVDWPRGDDQLRKARADVSVFAEALNQFKLENGYYPKTGDGLEALIVKPRDANDTWKGPYLQPRVPLDPWKRPYVYVIPGEHNPDSFDVYSKGKNGLGGKEAIGNWKD